MRDNLHAEPLASPLASPLAATTAAPPPDFLTTQHRFAAHIRDPRHQPAPPDVEDQRMAIYRDLFFNNMSSLLQPVFPVVHQLLGPSRWQALVRDFMVHHRANTPLFPELAQELLDYLGRERPERLAARPGQDKNGNQAVKEGASDPPFLLELAHYEWVEMALTISDEEITPQLADPDGDLLAAIPVLSPLAWALSYCFPVHRIGPDYQPAEPPAQPTQLVVYRNRQDQVAFLEINLVTARLLQLMKDHPTQTGLRLLETVANEMQHPKPGQVINAGAGLLADLRTRDVIIGTRHPATL